MPTIDEMRSVKAKIEQLQRQLGEIDGREKRIAQELHDLGFENLEAAKKALPAERKKLESLRERRDELLAKFNREYQAYLAARQS